MFDAFPRPSRLLIAAALTGFTVAGVAPYASGQIKQLRKGDDQFIQQLREQGMSDLLERFVETDPPEDPIARLALDVALKEFVATDLLNRAFVAKNQNDFEAANARFQESRETFEEVLAAQRELIAQNPEDERLPIWQIDFSEMLIDRYLPRYFNNVNWIYEFGLPSPEQAEAYEQAMIESLKVTSEATNKLDLLASRVGNQPALRGELEELGIWFRLEDYRRINGPYWYAHAAHGVSLLPDDHAYFSNRQVRNQQGNAADEKNRLRNQVINSTEGPIKTDPRTELTAKLLSGKTLAWSSIADDNDDAVDMYLEEAIRMGDGQAQGFLARLAKAVARWNVGEKDTAVEILQGMGNDRYVQSDATGSARLLAADLLFKILMIEAERGPADKKAQNIAEAYELAYVPLISDPNDPRFRNILFPRWAAEAEGNENISDLPATVRMGIGDQLTQQGGGLAQQVVNLKLAPAPAIPAEAEVHEQTLQNQRKQATDLLNRAIAFNSSLTGDDLAKPIVARGFYNLGLNRYGLAEMKRVFEGGEAVGWEPYFEIAQTWFEVAKRAPDSPQAQQSIEMALGYFQLQDVGFNSETIQMPAVRDAYQEAFLLINELWPQSVTAHNNRVYAGFHLFEKQGMLDEAVAVYRDLPPDHKDYFQARRQMVSAMNRQYRSNADALILHLATQPASAPPGADAQTIETAQTAMIEWERERDALVETLTRQSGSVIEDAEILQLDAEDEVENARDNERRFTAATALGASTIVLAGMKSDAGETQESLELLKGFEEKYSPKDGVYARLASVTNKPEANLANLQGLIQSAQEQRIISLLEAGELQEMAKQANIMMNDAPEVAAAVAGGVLRRVRAQIEIQERIEREAPFRRQKEEAREQIMFLGGAAVELTNIVVQWAKGQNFNPERMIPFQIRLADALMLAGKAEDALKIMVPIEKQIPNNFNISMMTGNAHLEVFKLNKNPKHYNAAQAQYTKIIKYYNVRPEKPDYFWDAWLQTFRLLDAAGPPQANVISKRARMLQGIDPEFGGPSFKDRFMDVIERNGGIEQLNLPG